MLDTELSGKAAIVTGASSGIGRATSLAFAREGARVALVSRNEEKLSEVADTIRESGGEAVVVPVDVTSTDALKKAFEKIMTHFSGQLDILVNAAGIIASGTIENTTLDDWDKMFAINVRSVFYLSQLAVPFLKKTKGSILNVSSVTGLRAFPNVLAYAASKAAVDQLTRSAALELAPVGIRVNAVNPGVVVTELHKRGGMDDEAYQNFLEHSKTTHPLGRVGKPEEVADLILFLVSPRAAWITGVTYSIDGGRAQTCFR
ncbi:MAG: glucose 1-dehydrogenase [Calditrichaeota bacterium]|nr:glucose 1-dehydrogenase [Calditrichota bacterium]